MLDLLATRAPSPARLAAFHKLRCAARLDPVAAYNLGNYFADPPGPLRLRPRRRQRSLALFHHAAELGLVRLDRPLRPYAKAPRHEHGLRDIISRALTNTGGALSNAGAPDLAVDYFEKALKLFPANSNAEVCFGNMGVYHPDKTGVDPLTAIAAWERAAALGDCCHESDRGCACRANVIQVARQIEREYGADAARAWISGRYARADVRKSGRDFGPVARAAGDVARIVPGTRWARRAVAVADALRPFLDARKEQALEVKVTLAGSLVGSLCRLSLGPRPGDPAVLDRALARANAAEPLEAFLGDEEWADVGPPETLYLTEMAEGGHHEHGRGGGGTGVGRDPAAYSPRRRSWARFFTSTGASGEASWPWCVEAWPRRACRWSTCPPSSSARRCCIEHRIEAPLSLVPDVRRFLPLRSSAVSYAVC